MTSSSKPFKITAALLALTLVVGASATLLLAWAPLIGDALCAKMKAECEVVTSDWDGIIPALNAKKFDFLVSSLSITDERKQAVDFTDPYYSNKLQFIAPKATADFKTDATYLKGKVIDVLENGYTLHDKVIRYAKVVVGE